MKKGFRLLAALWLLIVLLSVSALADITVYAADYPVERDGWYDTMEEVTVYLTLFDELPQNYMTKKEAQKLGWVSSKGNLWDVAYGCSIGGDRFGNYEGVLPEKKGRTWTECDIGFEGDYRGAQRIVFSSDDLIYYTDDHYNTFEKVNVVKETTKKQTSNKNNKNAKAKDGVLTVNVSVEYGESYTNHEEVAAYLAAFGELPINYIVKDDAYDLGFSVKKDNMGVVAPEFAIGGDQFGNREGLLPKAKGRQYYECDVDMIDGKRGDCRIVYSDDGLIFYTNDKYKSFVEVKVEN
ncbi:MAG: hypothetical protein IKU73_00070 [Clostridia bacterium]|nr:hypothetical protein [Clostridia bacterium]